ncbi:MAG TPA: hypothetical protein VGF70_15760, partial [Solirubrobacteraceae bacterium]
MPAILAKKLGMTQRFGEDGRVERVTVLEAGPCPVTAIRTVGSGIVTEILDAPRTVTRFGGDVRVPLALSTAGLSGFADEYLGEE